MADKTKKVAIQLSLDVDKQGAVAQVKGVTEQMKKILTSFEKSGGSFEIFNDLVGYLKAVEEQCLRLKNINPVKFNDLFGKEGGADLNSAISSQITGILDTAKQVPDVIAKVQDKINNLKNQTSIKVGEVRDIGNDIKGLYTLMGQTPKIDLDFKGQRGNIAQLDVLSNALKDFKVDWLEFVNTIKDNPNPLNRNVGNGNADTVKDIDKQIKALEKQKNFYEQKRELINQLLDSGYQKMDLSMVTDPDTNVESKKNYNAFLHLVQNFQKASQELKELEPNTDEYAQQYIKAYEYALKLQDTLKEISVRMEAADTKDDVDENILSDRIRTWFEQNVSESMDAPYAISKKWYGDLSEILDNSFADDFGGFVDKEITKIDSKIKQLQDNILGTAQESQSTVTSMLSEITNEAENAITKVENMALRIGKAFDMVHDADVEFRITVGDQGLDIRSGATNEIDTKTLVENYLANINKGITLGAHSHRGISSGWSVNDVREAIKSQFLGLSKVDAVFGDRDITSINFSGVAKEIADQILSAIENDANMKQFGELKAEGINRIAKQFGAGDIAKVWDVSNGTDDFVKYINEIESASQAAIEPVDRLKNLLTYLKPNIDFSKYNGELETFVDGTSSVADVFNKIAKSEGISTIVDNTTFSSLSDMTAKMAQQQEEYQDKLYNTKLTFKEVLDMVQQVKDAGSNRSDIENVFGNIFNTKDLRDIFSLFEKISNPLDIAKSVVAKFDYDPYDDILNMVQTMIPNEEMSLAQLQELLNKRKELMSELKSSDDISDKYADLMRRDEIAQEEAINKTLEERISTLNELALKNQDVSGKEIEQQNITNQDQTAQLEKEKELTQELQTLREKLASVPKNPVDTSELEMAKKQAQDLEAEIQRMQGALDEWRASYSDLLNNTVPIDEIDNMTSNDVVDSYRDKVDNLQSMINQLNEELTTTKASLEEMQTTSQGTTDSVEVKVLREQVAQLESQLAQVQSGQRDTAEFSSEVQNLETLRTKLEAVKNAIIAKNKAFNDEGAVVGQVVGKEIAALQHLLDRVNEISEALEKHFENISSKINTTNINTDSSNVSTKNRIKEIAQLLPFDEWIAANSGSGNYFKEILSAYKSGEYDPAQKEQFWREARYEKQVNYKPINSDEAYDIISEKIGDNILSGWYRSAESAYKKKMENIALSDDDVRNAGLNVLWKNYKDYIGKDIGFDEFLHSDIPVYRGKNSEKFIDGDELLSFSFDPAIAEKFGNTIVKAIIKPIETIGNFQTTGEGEVLVRRDSLPMYAGVPNGTTIDYNNPDDKNAQNILAISRALDVQTESIERNTEARQKAANVNGESSDDIAHLNTNSSQNAGIVNAESGGYALESTLEQTNTILGEIKSSVDAIGRTAPKNPRPTLEANARIADSKEYEHIKDIALNSIGDKGTDPQITGVKALADGLVQVNGYIKTVKGNYEDFVVKVNSAGEAIGLAFSDNKKLTQQMQAEAAAQEAFSNNFNLVADEFVKYTDSIDQSDQITAKFSNQIQQMESRLATVSNGAELDAWKADWDALTASIAAAKQEQEKLILEGQKRKDTGTLNSVEKSATEIYKSLKIDPTKMTPELEEIRKKYLDIVGVIAEYKKKREALTQEEINGLKQAEAELQKEAQAYAQKMQAEQKQKEAAQKAYGASQVKNLGKKYTQLSGVASGAEFADSSTVQSALSTLEASYQRLVDKQKEFIGIDPTSEQKQEFAQLTDQYNQAYKALDNIIKSSRKLQEQGVGDPYEIVSGTNMGDQSVRMQELQNAVNLFSNGSAKIGQFNADFTELSYTVKNADGTFTDFTAVLDRTGTKIVNVAGKTKESTSLFKGAFDSIKKKSKEILTYMVSMGGLSRVMGQVKQGIQYVKEIDTALTELKKVTDETDATYKRFLQTASQASSEIGSTIADFTNATADFARLGYTITEATDLAKAASIYKNVGDGINSVSDASESIISTMKAFGIEANDAIGIVDRFNEVGNNFAISSTGIGEALQRSASALYESGNTIDESIALITAANSVVQNPETVG